MAIDNTKAIKELLETINNKVGKIEDRQHDQSVQLHLMKDKQSVINEKLDDLKKDVKELTENCRTLWSYFTSSIVPFI